jgi:hypothetical protein
MVSMMSWIRRPEVRPTEVRAAEVPKIRPAEVRSAEVPKIRPAEARLPKVRLPEVRPPEVRSPEVRAPVSAKVRPAEVRLPDVRPDVRHAFQAAISCLSKATCSGRGSAAKLLTKERQAAGAAAWAAVDKRGVTRLQPHISRQSAQCPLRAKRESG